LSSFESINGTLGTGNNRVGHLISFSYVKGE
jgi:hypothetical protein